MYWPFILIGLIAIAFCIFLIYSAVRAHAWYKYYSKRGPKPVEPLAEEAKKKIPGDIWIIFIGIASILMINIFTIIPILGGLFAFVAGIVLLALFSTFKKEGKENAFYPFMYWSVALGAALGIISGFVLFVLGFTTTPKKLLENSGLINIPGI